MSGGGGGGSQHVTQETTTKPWDIAVPFATQIIGQGGLADDLLKYWQGGGQNPFPNAAYPGQRVAGLDPAQSQSYQMLTGYTPDIIQYGMTPFYDAAKSALSPTLDQDLMNQGYKQAVGTILPTAEGKYLTPDSNPYLKAYGEAAIQPIIDQNQRAMASLNNQAQGIGQYGTGSAWAQLQAQNLSNMNRDIGQAEASIYSPAYQQERQMQMAAAQMPMEWYERQKQLEFNAVNPFNDIIQQGMQLVGGMEGAGEMQRGYQQQMLDAAMSQYNEQQMAPYQRIAQLLGLATGGGNMGGTSSTSQPLYQPSLGQQLLGGAGMGLGMLSKFM